MRALTVDDLSTMISDAMATGDWASVAELEPRLDRVEVAYRRPASSCVAAALFYASLGLRVFPLQAGAKIPQRGTRGFKDAGTDPELITSWWRRWPDANVAIATGHLVDVIDIDGPVGVESWAKLDGLPPALGTVSTPRAGGRHLYVPASGEGNAAAMFPGIDYRGLGGYVVAPPSVNAEGKPYRWCRPLQLAAPARVAAWAIGP